MSQRKKQQISVSLPKDILAQVDRIARLADTERSTVLRVILAMSLLRRHVANRERTTRR